MLLYPYESCQGGGKSARIPVRIAARLMMGTTVSALAPLALRVLGTTGSALASLAPRVMGTTVSARASLAPRVMGTTVSGLASLAPRTDDYRLGARLARASCRPLPSWRSLRSRLVSTTTVYRFGARFARASYDKPAEIARQRIGSDTLSG